MHLTWCVWFCDFMWGCLYKNKSWSESVKRERKQKETQIDYGMLLFLYKGRLWRAPAVYWFSELLCSHCYPRVLSTVHWTHAAPQAVIPVWETPALTTGPSQSTQLSAAFIPIQAYVSTASTEEVAGNHKGIRASRLILTYLKSFVRGVEDGEYFFLQMRKLDYIPLCHEEEEEEEVKGSDQQGKPIFQTDCT